MKNIYLKTLKKLLPFKNGLVTLALKWVHSLKKDFSFYNSHTELLAIWTVLFLTITGLFFFAIKSGIAVMFFLLILTAVIMFIGTFVATYYLYALKFHHKKRLLPKVHNFLNKSFKFRNLLHFIKIPSFKNLIKIKFKFAS